MPSAITRGASLLLLLAACGDAGSSAATSAAPVASAAAVSPTASASAASANPGSRCPEGSAGPGTNDDPCIGTGEIVESVWTTRIDKGGAVFKVTNKTNHQVRYVSQRTYYYDKDGKQLGIPKSYAPTAPPDMFHSASGGVYVLKPGESREMTLGYSQEKIPDGTVTVESVTDNVGWPPDDAPDADPEKWTYWKNKSLGLKDRPKTGK